VVKKLDKSKKYRIMGLEAKKMEPLGKFKFSMVAGIVARKHIRTELNTLLADLRYYYPDSRCYLNEAKRFLESTFLFGGHDVPKNAILKLKEALEKWTKKMGAKKTGDE